MLLAVVVLACLQVEICLGAGDPGLTALKFHDADSYISYEPDMESFFDLYTLCSWVRKLKTESDPIWFTYNQFSIRMTDNGLYFNVGKGCDAKEKFESTMAPEEWYHVCSTWSSESNMARIYWNGVLVCERETSQWDTVPAGKTLIIGNYSPGYERYFGGELYGLNMYSKVLSSKEMIAMSAFGGPCPGGDDRLEDYRNLKWEDILQQTKSGNVREIDISSDITPACEIVNDLMESAKSKLTEMESQLDLLAAGKREVQQRLDAITQEQKEATQQQQNAEQCFAKTFKKKKRARVMKKYDVCKKKAGNKKTTNKKM